jgi:hypothetical protein
MPTFTSVKSGYWNDPTVWDQNAVPTNGDSVVIAAGHTVIFNVDQSSFPTGLAGLTINGTLKIPSKAEDPSMPNTVVLKVNANIAGSGSFLIGSPTQPITYPQFVKVMVNGTITVATFNAYGEQRSPLWDYLAQDAPAGATTIVLQNGLPLRSGDLIAIGRSDIVGSWTESSTARGLHTVASYNAATKTVTLNEALTHARSGTGVRACLVILLSRQIVISKYGTNAAYLLTGSGRTLQGVQFNMETGASFPSGGVASVSSSTFTYFGSSFSYGEGLFYNSSNITFDHVTVYGGGALSFMRMGPNNSSLTNGAIINFFRGMAGYVLNLITITNLHVQNFNAFSWNEGSGTVQTNITNLTSKNGHLFTSTHVSFVDWIIQMRNVVIVDGNILGMPNINSLYASIDNIDWYAFLNSDYWAVGAMLRASVLIKNLTGQHYVSGRRLILSNGAANVAFISCHLSGNGNGQLDSGSGSTNKYIKCSITNAFNPLINNHLSSVSEIINLSTNAYYRPTLRIPSVVDQLWSNRIIVKGLTVAGTQHPRAFEHLFPHGYVKNRWDAATPDYTTFDFRLTQSSFSGQPIWLEYQVFTADPIRVTGTISQLGTGESVKVQIFSAGKEPLYGDTPDFEQTYTSLGDINVNWTPPDARTWVVRVLAYPQQTTTPITIANLQVAGGGSGSDGAATTVGEPAFVFVG